MFFLQPKKQLKEIMDYPGTTARYYRVIGNTGNAAVKEPCYNVLKCLGILAATYKHAQDAFSTNRNPS